MQTPFHVRGITFFPRAKVIGLCWFAELHIVQGFGDVATHKCFGVFGKENEALIAARSEAVSLARAIRDRRFDVDTD